MLSEKVDFYKICIAKKFMKEVHDQTKQALYVHVLCYYITHSNDLILVTKLLAYPYYQLQF